MKPNKQFDCVKLKNAIQEIILEETNGMTAGELLSYFNSFSDIDDANTGKTTVKILDVTRECGELEK